MTSQGTYAALEWEGQITTRPELLHQRAGLAPQPPRLGQTSKGMRSPRHLATPGNTITYGATCVGRAGGMETGRVRERTLGWVVNDGRGKAFQTEGPAKAKA